MGPRHGLGALLVLTLLSGGCGKSESQPQGGASPAATTPVQMSIPSGDRTDVLGPDNIKAEIDRAGLGTNLVKLDLSSAGLSLTMDAPAGAKVQQSSTQDVQVIAGDHFALQIKLGTRRLDRKKQSLAGQKVLINDKDLLLCESSLLLTARCEFVRHILAGHQDYCIENLDPLDGRLVNHTQSDCLLMLKCANTLAPKTTSSADPVAALQQLKANVSKGADGQVAGLVLDPHQTTDATLALLAKVPGLQRLDLHRCPITDAGLVQLGELTSLKDLNLSDCEFTDAGLSSLAGLTNLETLVLASSFGDSPQIKGPGLAALAGMTKLRVLVLDKNLVDDTGLVHLKNLRGLKELYLEQTRVVGPGLAQLKELSALTVLSLNETKVTDAGLEAIQELSSLEVLNLRGTPINGEGIKRLHGLKNLHTLNLGNTPLTDAGLVHVADLTTLKRLVLEGTEVSDTGLEHLRGMKGLKQVALMRTKVTKAGADKLKAALPGVEVAID
jgi:hypothetical protein